MVELNWNPVPHLGPIPVNWYGLNFALAFLVGGWLVWRWAPKYDVPREKVEGLLVWITAGTIIGARFYYIIQNDPGGYLSDPWRVFAVWEGGLAYFGGLFGAILAAYIFAWRVELPFARTADLFAPAVPVGAALGRISCGLAGMDYGTPTALPWGIVYTSPNSYAPMDGVARHPAQFYELLGNLVIAGALVRLRGKLPEGALFLLYLVLFSVLRFFIFFVRGSVPEVAMGLKNAQWTALAILSVATPILIAIALKGWRKQQPA
jgi:phosphatidylglycerol:prolipoprotein diacylglycerol transferase